jgi:hypothetical protein
MAHFAELNIDNIVQQVLVVSNSDIVDSNGIESEEIGIGFLKKLFGANTIWKQTSYNGNFRKNYAGIGYIYDEQRDAFIPLKPYPSWVLNEDTCLWESPIPYPNDGNHYIWDEETLSWIIFEV